MARKSPWVPTSEAAEALGVSAKFLRARRDQLFKKGVHYRVINPEAWRPEYRWHLPKLERLMAAGDDPTD
jgi:predicted ArsR family transcriptional regulator